MGQLIPRSSLVHRKKIGRYRSFESVSTECSRRDPETSENAAQHNPGFCHLLIVGTRPGKRD